MQYENKRIYLNIQMKIKIEVQNISKLQEK